jgi:hypothetical protein
MKCDRVALHSCLLVSSSWLTEDQFQFFSISTLYIKSEQSLNLQDLAMVTDKTVQAIPVQ